LRGTTSDPRVYSLSGLGFQEPSSEGRGDVALRGLFWGAVAGGAYGYLNARGDEHLGVAGSVIVGAIVGAPIGMLLFLLLTPA
jgi:hypothetical protein